MTLDSVYTIASRWLLLVLFSCTITTVHAQSKHLIKVEKKLAKGDTNKALKKLNKYLDKHPSEAALYLKRAKLKIERGDLDPAMADLNSFCSLNKICGEADMWKGIVLYKQGNYLAAIERLSDYTRVKTSDGEAFLYLGLAHVWLQNYTIALQALERAGELDPSNDLAWYNSGLSAFYSEDYAAAEGFFLRATEANAEDSDYLMALSNTYRARENFEKSNAILSLIKAGDRNYASALFNSAVNHYHQDDLAAACSLWEEAKEAGHLKAEDNLRQYCALK